MLTVAGGTSGLTSLECGHSIHSRADIWRLCAFIGMNMSFPCVCGTFIASDVVFHNTNNIQPRLFPPSITVFEKRRFPSLPLAHMNIYFRRDKRRNCSWILSVSKKLLKCSLSSRYVFSF